MQAMPISSWHRLLSNDVASNPKCTIPLLTHSALSIAVRTAKSRKALTIPSAKFHPCFYDA